MFHFRLKVISALALSFFALTSIKARAQEAPFSQSPWEYVEHELLVKPSRELATWPNRCKRWGAAILTHLIAPQTFNIPFVPAIAAFKWVESRIKSNLEYQAFKNFIARWPHHQECAPTEIKEKCQNLYGLYQIDEKSTLFKEQAQSALAWIRHLIHQQFSWKYCWFTPSIKSSTGNTGADRRCV